MPSLPENTCFQIAPGPSSQLHRRFLRCILFFLGGVCFLTATQ